MLLTAVLGLKNSHTQHGNIVKLKLPTSERKAGYKYYP